MGCHHTFDEPGEFAARTDNMPGDGRGAARAARAKVVGFA